MITDRYKIIEQRDGNGDGWYEVWFEHNILWFWTRWIAVKTYPGYPCPGYITRFYAPGMIDHYLRAKKITRTVVRHCRCGDINQEMKNERLGIITTNQTH